MPNTHDGHKDNFAPNSDLVQREALRQSTDDRHSGSNLDGMMARVSAEVTAEAARKRATGAIICQRCGKPQHVGCLQDAKTADPTCPNVTGALRT